MAQVIITGIGAIVGSLVRFGLLQLGSKYFGVFSDLMVVFINLLAAFLMGIVLGIEIPKDIYTFLAPGILGGLSTFSAPIVDIADAIETHGNHDWLVLGKTIVTFGGGLIIIWLGMQIGNLF